MSHPDAKGLPDDGSCEVFGLPFLSLELASAKGSAVRDCIALGVPPPAASATGALAALMGGARGAIGAAGTGTA